MVDCKISTFICVAAIAALTILSGCDRQDFGGLSLQGQSSVRNREALEQAQARDAAEKERARVEAAEKAKREAQLEEIAKRKKRALKIIEVEVAADKKLVESLRHELELVDSDRRELMTRFDGIDVPKFICRTNAVRLVNGQVKRKVERVKLSEDQRLKERLMNLYDDQAVRDMYSNYTDSTAKKVLDEFESEWTDANDKYEGVTLALQKVDDEERKEKDELSAKFSEDRTSRINGYRRRMERIKIEMKPIKKKIGEHTSGRCRIRTMAKPGRTQACNCDINSWRSQLNDLEREYYDCQSSLNAEKSTAIGQDENRQIDGVSSRASQKRARINQEYTHQVAVLKEIVDKYNRLLMENLIGKMKDRKEYLTRRIAEVVGKNEIKARYLDGRSELSPELALDFIKDSERRDADMLGVSRRSAIEMESAKAHQRKLELIKESNTFRVSSDAKLNVRVDERKTDGK